jgi:hypothetical protein
MELTLLESKTQPWRKLAIEKLMAQFEEQIPIDHSLVNWDDFFSSYLVFTISYELACIDVNYLEIYNWIKGITFPQNFDQFKEINESKEGRFSDISVLVLNSSYDFGTTPSDIYKTYMGTNKIIVGNDGEKSFTVGSNEVNVYTGSSWQQYVVSAT